MVLEVGRVREQDPTLAKERELYWLRFLDSEKPPNERRHYLDVSAIFRNDPKVRRRCGHRLALREM